MLDQHRQTFFFRWGVFKEREVSFRIMEKKGFLNQWVDCEFLEKIFSEGERRESSLICGGEEEEMGGEI